MLILIIGFTVVGYYQAALHRRLKTGRREKSLAYSVTGLAFVYSVLCHYSPVWVNPNNAIRLVFEPLQSWLLQN
ncbi:hypothetical protein PAECIP111893_03036 [Paenibacillus plantiphilus]|uniref:Uncharacterized protein n=1 Tax=Paenibacillus plantiphilus TaxID=2905650 RepID=A0ABN8GK34_9BACL|nr:hypothetical protein [Paenibacillus plantiphilus]CAH1209498.1 hypothetical protein PAECIP111893_03036 [Paenibacillus plantiphilus]